MIVLRGEFLESAPQSLEFNIKYDNDPNTNIPALRVNVLEMYSNLNAHQSLLSGNRKVIPVTNARFTDYHNILYYIYTGSLNLRYPPSKDLRPVSSSAATPGVTNGYAWDAFPRAANANEIYRLAGVMGLTELQTRAYHYLMSTCSADNIFDRLFDPYCKATTHAPVRNVYQQYLARNWDTIRGSGQWAQLLRRYRSSQREDEAETILEAICEILSAVTWDHKLTNWVKQ